ncbi:MAG: 30S ribosomal protein S21 [Patescibacteria group bacterium]|nr:30S ribosomal protein S21 [Patescibacteria group bacterium]
MTLAIKKKGETKETLFRKFTKIFIEEDVVSEVRKRLFYKKPSLARREEEKEKIKIRAKKRYGQHNLPVKVQN